MRLKNKIPRTGIYDLAFQTRENDLAIATHGRGIIIIDDLTPLRCLTQDVLEQEFAFLPVRNAVAGYPGKPADLQIKALDNYARQVKDFGSRIDLLLMT